MREFKFRAWDKQDKRMITDEQEFIPVKVTNKGVLKLSPHHQENLWSFIDGDRFEIMQFIGLPDIMGNDIYEGDIVLLDILNVQQDPIITDENKKQMFKRDLKIISFDKGTFGFYPIFPDLNHIDDRGWSPIIDGDIELWTRYMKVIGNIYENPELLK